MKQKTISSALFKSVEIYKTFFCDDSQGRPLANQNVGAVVYIRTTDSNGIASLNINLRGEYIITSYDFQIGNKISIS